MVAQTEDLDREAYREHVDVLADSIEEDVDEYDRDIHDMIWEEVDGSGWIIYTNRALKVLEYASNEPQEWKDLVGDDESSWQKVISTMAFTALRWDLLDELERRGVLHEHQ